MTTLQQLKEEARKELDDQFNIRLGHEWTLKEIKNSTDSYIDKAFAAGKEEVCAEIVEEVENMLQARPSRVCLNAKTNLFGRCFDIYEHSHILQGQGSRDNI